MAQSGRETSAELRALTLTTRQWRRCVIGSLILKAASNNITSRPSMSKRMMF
jgi:hypothetical protein